MKTTLNLDDNLIAAAKEFAAGRGVTLTALVEDALRERLGRPAPSDGYVLHFPVVGGSAPPAVDPADRDALEDFMNEQ